MDTTLAKVLTAILLFILTMVFSFLPYFIFRRGLLSLVSTTRRESILAYLNCFAGGVFLATFLCHILAEGGEEFDDYKEKAGLDMDFPLFNVFVACGFFLVAFIELVAQTQMRKSSSSNQINHETPGARETTDARARPSEGNKSYRSGVSNVGFPNASHQDYSDLNRITNDNDQDFHSHGPKHVGLRAFMLLIALSFHTIFDGLAVGLQTSDSEVWVVFAAITIHKSIISFCLGLEIFKTNLQKLFQTVLWLFIFAIMSPVGIGIGIGLTTGDSHELSRLLASSVLQGLAAGTFMYVTFLEILNTHMGHHSQGNFFHVTFALIGFAIMALTKLFDKD